MCSTHYFQSLFDDNNLRCVHFLPRNRSDSSSSYIVDPCRLLLPHSSYSFNCVCCRCHPHPRFSSPSPIAASISSAHANLFYHHLCYIRLLEPLPSVRSSVRLPPDSTIRSTYDRRLLLPLSLSSPQVSVRLFGSHSQLHIASTFLVCCR